MNVELQKETSMKSLTRALFCLIALTLGAGTSAAQANAHSTMAPGTGSPGFDKLKTLVGEWEGKAQDGARVNVSYRLVSNGTALMETLHPTGESEMVTVYTADCDRVAVTHYCNANNQPHMRTAPVSGNPQKFDFPFVSVTNLASPTAGHMHHLAVTLTDNDHFSQTWTWRENGKDKTNTFLFFRKK